MPRVYPDEAINGLIIRITEANQFSDPIKVSKSAGLDFPLLYFTPEQLSRLALLADTPIEEIRAPWLSLNPAMEPTPAYGRYLGDAWPELQRGHRYYCPHCLADAPYHRLAWTFYAIRVCVKHRVQLQSICPKPKCKLGHRWRTHSNRACQCGQDLTEATAEPVSDVDLEGASYIQRQLFGSDGDTPELLSGLTMATLPQVLVAAANLPMAIRLDILDDAADPGGLARYGDLKSGDQTIVDGAFPDLNRALSLGLAMMTQPADKVGAAIRKSLLAIEPQSDPYWIWHLSRMKVGDRLPRVIKQALVGVDTSAWKKKRGRKKKSDAVTKNQ